MDSCDQQWISATANRVRQAMHAAFQCLAYLEEDDLRAMNEAHNKLAVIDRDLRELCKGSADT